MTMTGNSPRPTPVVSPAKIREQQMLRMLSRLDHALLERERELMTRKWFDYRFLSPYEATDLFKTHYIAAHKRAWRTNIDHATADRHPGLPEQGLPRPGRTLTSLWTCRQFADELQVPYDVFCEAAFATWFDHWAKRVPRPNQFYSAVWKPRVEQAVAKRWQDICESSIRVGTIPQLEIGARETAAQQDHFKWCIEFLKMPRASNGPLGEIVFVRRMLPEDLAIREFGIERVEMAKQLVAFDEPRPLSAKLTKDDLRPACFLTPHAYRAGSKECEPCHLSAHCDRLDPMLLEKAVARFGTTTPVIDKKRSNGAERTRKCRARQKMEATGPRTVVLDEAAA